VKASRVLAAPFAVCVAVACNPAPTPRVTLDPADAAGPYDAGAVVAPVACSVVVTDVPSLTRALAAAAPGTTVCLADGTYENLDLAFTARGSSAAPVVLSAQHPGRAVFTGLTRVSIGGAFVTLQGIFFRGGQSLGTSLVELKNGSTVCDDCRVTDIAIVDVDLGNRSDTKWVSLYGQRDRVYHCAFSGKTNPGTLLVVWRSGARADDDRIEHNLFANRPPLSSNGNEAVRVGTGAEAASDSRTAIEENLFEAMSGDAEVISIKSGANVIRHNTIRRSLGTLTLRNGAGSVVDGNIILTDRLIDAGGIRVIGPRHRVINNYVEGVRTTSSARGGIALLSGQPNPGPGDDTPVSDVLVAFNTLVDCDASFIFGAGTNPLAPSNVTVANNLVSGARGAVVAPGVGLATPRLAGNLYDGAPLGLASPKGFTGVDARLLRAADGLLRPAPGSPAIDAAMGAFGVQDDLDGQPRTGPFDVGCDETDAPGPTRAPLTRDDVGPTRWRPPLR